MDKNSLYPIFLKAHRINILIVGAGNVGLEKLSYMIKSSPNANITVVAPMFIPEIMIYEKYENITFVKSKFKKKHLRHKHLVIGATNFKRVNQRIRDLSKSLHILVNIADTPELCDFYLGGIVTKGHLKVAISTNGQSPTIAKQLRRFFESVIPNDIDDLLVNLRVYRDQLKGGFEEKVKTMNEITKQLISK